MKIEMCNTLVKKKIQYIVDEKTNHQILLLEAKQHRHNNRDPNGKHSTIFLNLFIFLPKN